MEPVRWPLLARSSLINKLAKFGSLQKSDAVRGGNFDAKDLNKLPLPNLNPYEIARLLPGVVLPTGTTNFGNFGSSGFSINGSRPRGNNYLLDGTENNDPCDRPGVQPGE